MTTIDAALFFYIYFRRDGATLSKFVEIPFVFLQYALLFTLAMEMFHRESLIKSQPLGSSSDHPQVYTSAVEDVSYLDGFVEPCTFVLSACMSRTFHIDDVQQAVVFYCCRCSCKFRFVESNTLQTKNLFRFVVAARHTTTYQIYASSAVFPRP